MFENLFKRLKKIRFETCKLFDAGATDRGLFLTVIPLLVVGMELFQLFPAELVIWGACADSFSRHLPENEILYCHG